MFDERLLVGETLLFGETLSTFGRVTGWGGRDRTSEWRNQNQLDYSTISTGIWKKWIKRPLATSIAWRPFPNEKQALPDDQSGQNLGANCAEVFKSFGLERLPSEGS